MHGNTEFPKSFRVSFQKNRQREARIMKHCPNCNAIYNPRWEKCAACGHSFKTDQPRTEYPISVKMESAILGAIVNVDLWPDRATVDGVNYSLPELRDLLSRKISHDGLREVHALKQEFEGTVIS